MDEVGNNSPGLLLHSNVRWLSRGKVLSRFAACLGEIRTFLEMKNVEHFKLTNPDWLRKFYYVADMIKYPNQLLSLQQTLFAFENKLDLFIADLETGRLLHFERLKKIKDAFKASNPTQYFGLQQLVGFTFNFLQSFKVIFEEFRERTSL